MARSLKKGPFADKSLLKKVDALNASGIGQQRGRKDLVPPFHYFPVFRRTHDCSA